ncbi:MAG: T9SS type A sorting domain-containing protein, partial [Prevotellaceae bacterium]|nr:T9SS type A sorting domain-containing protein [Prevotellaceae bacterium]
ALENRAQSLNTLSKETQGNNNNATGLLAPKTDGLRYALYPNPVLDSFQVEGLSKGEDYKYMVYSIEGKLLLTNELPKEKNTLDVLRLPPAVYLMEIKANSGESQYVRFVKAR